VRRNQSASLSFIPIESNRLRSLDRRNDRLISSRRYNRCGDTYPSQWSAHRANGIPNESIGHGGLCSDKPETGSTRRANGRPLPDEINRPDRAVDTIEIALRRAAGDDRQGMQGRTREDHAIRASLRIGPVDPLVRADVVELYIQRLVHRESGPGIALAIWSRQAGRGDLV